MHKKTISLLTALFLAVIPCNSVNVNAEGASNADNAFSMNYTYDGTNVVSVFSVDGENVSVGGFEATLQYDTTKYTVQSHKAIDSNILINVIPSDGEIVVSMASASDNLLAASELFSIDFECVSIPVKSDFSFDIADVYRIADNYDAESVEYTFNESWVGFEETPVVTTTTTEHETTTTTTTTATSENIATDTTTTEVTTTTETTTEGTTTTTQATTLPNESGSNNFVISVKRNEAEGNVELSFVVKGNVGFWTTEGQININSVGLGIPELVSAIPDALTSYNSDENAIYFTIVSSSGGNITEEQVVFTYTFPIEETEYSISCTGCIEDICDQNYNTVSYTLTEENEITPSQTTTTTVTTTEITTTTTTQTTDTQNTTSSTDTTTTDVPDTDTTTTTETTIVASPFELAKWAENDYYQKTGVEPYRSDYVENSNGTLTITLYDEQGNILDTYTVHSKTGIGFNSNGDEVDLPQTGNNSLTPILIIFASLLFIILGAYAIKASGIVDSKQRHEKG